MTLGPQAACIIKEDKVIVLESILQKIGMYGLKLIFMDVTQRLTSYKDIYLSVKSLWLPSTRCSTNTIHVCKKWF